MSRKEIISIRCTKEEKDELMKLLYTIKANEGNIQNINILLNSLTQYINK